MAENPYASPVAPIEIHSGSGPEQLRIASQGKRFLNMILDSIIVQVLSAAAGFVFGLFFMASRMAANEMVTDNDLSGLELFGYLIGIVVTLVYFIVMESVFQRTLGKFLTGTMVVTANGERPPFGHIVGRSFARFIPFEAFSFLAGKNPVGWHDSLSGTRVVNLR